MLMNRIFELRKAAGLSQKELAKKTGVNQTAVSQWETGRTEPRFEAIANLCTFFNVSFEYLLGQSNKRGRFNMTLKEEDDFAKLLVYEMNQEHYEAYEKLDQHGKDIVDAVTKIELARIRDEGDNTHA